MESLTRCLEPTTDIDYGDYLLSLRSMTVFLPLKRYHESLWLAIPKYKIGTSNSTPTPWRLAGFTLHRLYHTYTPREIGNAIDHLLQEPFSTELGAPLPILDASSSIRCSSQRATNALLEKPGDIPGAADALEALVALGIGTARITGSYALSAAHSRSDIDIVIDGYHTAISYVQEVVNKGPPLIPLRGERLEKWVAKEASTRRLEPGIVASLYRPWQRMLIPESKREVAVALADSSLRRQPIKLVITVRGGGIIRGEGLIEGYEPLLLDFPARTPIRGLHGRDYSIVVFDGIFIPRLFEGGRFRYRGLKGVICWTPTDCEDAILVGVREGITYVAPA